MKTVIPNTTLLDIGITRNTIEDRKEATPLHRTIVLAVVFEATKPAIRDVAATTKGNIPARIPPSIVPCLRVSTIS